ncbi:hypothetical protein ACGFYT_17935 [Streptomyces sp. NPDC048208]|uniref:hypothetical protein n=1 Tax=Streptomyces sp. NPDC048208 TaxID=3365515 RepID=UPI0037119A38
MVAAAEAFNSPHDRGRETKVLLHLQHSFEMLPKASLVQKGIRVFDPAQGRVEDAAQGRVEDAAQGRVEDAAQGRSLGFETCVREAAEHPDTKLSEPDAGTLRAIDAMRDDEQHWFNQVSEQLLYGTIRSFRTVHSAPMFR